MEAVSYNSNRLQIGHEEVELEYDIEDIITVDDIIIVLQYVPGDTKEDQNIVAFDENANRIWTIEAPSEGVEGQPYNYIRYEDGQLRADNWNSFEYVVDLQTGEVTTYKKFDK